MNDRIGECRHCGAVEVVLLSGVTSSKDPDGHPYLSGSFCELCG